MKSALVIIAPLKHFVEIFSRLPEFVRGLFQTSEDLTKHMSPETLKRKNGINTPLLETGELRDSITWNSDATEGYVGSNNPKAIWQELGTSRGIPPRPFIARAAVQMEGEVDKMAERAVAAAFEERPARLRNADDVFRPLRNHRTTLGDDLGLCDFQVDIGGDQLGGKFRQGKYAHDLKSLKHRTANFP
jgi:phage gpG-like protein